MVPRVLRVFRVVTSQPHMPLESRQHGRWTIRPTTRPYTHKKKKNAIKERRRTEKELVRDDEGTGRRTIKKKRRNVRDKADKTMTLRGDREPDEEAGNKTRLGLRKESQRDATEWQRKWRDNPFGVDNAQARKKQMLVLQRGLRRVARIS